MDIPNIREELAGLGVYLSEVILIMNRPVGTGYRPDLIGVFLRVEVGEELVKCSFGLTAQLEMGKLYSVVTREDKFRPVGTRCHVYCGPGRTALIKVHPEDEAEFRIVEKLNAPIGEVELPARFRKILVEDGFTDTNKLWQAIDLLNRIRSSLDGAGFSAIPGRLEDMGIPTDIEKYRDRLEAE